MNTIEHYLVCLAEECMELSEAAALALRLGLKSLSGGTGRTNAERLVDELRDLLAVATILHQQGAIPYTVPPLELAANLVPPASTPDLLPRLIAESSHLGQRVAKALRFGLTEVQHGQGHTNAERIGYKVFGVVGLAIALQLDGAIDDFGTGPDQVLQKLTKIQTFMAISRQEGALV